MSDSQQIYHMFRTLLFSSLLVFQAALLTGCSDPEQKAMAKGAEAQALFDAKRMGEARTAIQKAIAIRDDITDLHLLHGRIEAATNNPEAAFSAYSTAASLDSANMEALTGVARFGMQAGHLQESEQAADHVLTLDPGDQNALLIKGIYNILHHRGEQALANADGILQRDPSSQGGVILKSRALSILDRPDEALKLVEPMGANAPSVGITRTLLELYRYKSDGPAMITQLEKLRRLSPGDASFVLDEANALYKLGKPDAARALLRGLILSRSVDADNARAVTDLWDEYDPAPLEPAILGQFPTLANSAARKAVARYYLARGEANSAAQSLGALSDADLVALKAQVDIAQDRVAPGLAAVDGILAQDKTNCDALLARAQATLALRRPTEAIIAAQLANANCPNLSPAFVVLAHAQQASGNDLAADLAFRDGVNHNTQDSRLTRTYMTWLEQRNQGVRAVSIARKLTNAAPALVSGWQLFLDLCKRDPDADCGADARYGLEIASRRYAVDRRPDDREPPSLFTRLDQGAGDDALRQAIRNSERAKQASDAQAARDLKL